MAQEGKRLTCIGIPHPSRCNSACYRAGPFEVSLGVLKRRLAGSVVDAPPRGRPGDV